MGTSRGGALHEDQSLAAKRDKGCPCLSPRPCVSHTAGRRARSTEVQGDIGQQLQSHFVLNPQNKNICRVFNLSA